MAEHMQSRVLVTGGAGFIGSNFVQHILRADEGLRVVTLDALTYAGSLENLSAVPGARHTFVRGDIRDAALVDNILKEHEIDTVVHFAAESHVDRSITEPAAFIDTNVVGTCVLLDSARRYWADSGRLSGDVRFHHVSTDEVFGSLSRTEPPFDEHSPYRPSSPYSASKAASDHFVRAYHRTFGLPITITNCSNNYGPHQHMEKFIPTIIRSCLEGSPIPVYGDGSNMRDWLYVEDHCSAIDLVIRRGTVGETYCIGASAERPNIELARCICRLMDERLPASAPHERLIQYVTDRPGHDWRYAVDAARLRTELGWSCRESLESGLARTVDWYVQRSGKRGAAGRHVQVAG